MSHLLAYLTDFPHHGSLLVFPICPDQHAFPKSIVIDSGDLHPSLEGRGQVATRLGAKEPKRIEQVRTHMVRG